MALPSISSHNKSGSENKDNCLSYGDVIIHPDKAWPWMGIIQYRPTAGQICPSCGCMKPPPATAEDTEGTNDVADNKEEIPLSNGNADLGEIAAEAQSALKAMAEDLALTTPEQLQMAQQEVSIATHAQQMVVQQLETSVAWLKNIVSEKKKALEEEQGGSWHQERACACEIEEPEDGEEDKEPADMKDEPEPSTSGPKDTSKWHVLWHPTYNSTPTDGQEVVLSSSGQDRYFQEGFAVLRPNTERRGIIKRIRQKIDGFVLPHFEWAVLDLPCDSSTNVQTVDQHPGHYVIKEGWIGNVFGVWNNVLFRMEDGTEFYLNDEAQDFSLHFSEYLCSDRNLPVDSFQLYPGMRVRAPYLVLKNAVWKDTEKGKLFDAETKAKIALSTRLWGSGNYDEKWWIGEGENDKEARETYLGKLSQLVEEEREGGVEEGVAEGKVGSEKKRKLVRTKGQLRIPENNNRNSRDTWTVSCPRATKAEAGEVEESNERNDEEMEEDVPTEDWTENLDYVEENSENKSSTKQMALMLSVVEIQPVKLDVEWRNQIQHGEKIAQPKENIILKEEFPNLEWFKVPSSFVFAKGLGTKLRCTLQETTTVVSTEEYRNKKVPAKEAGLSHIVGVGEKEEVTPNGPIIKQDKETENGPPKKSRSHLSEMIPIQKHSAAPVPGTQVFMYLVSGASVVDILWEDGEMEFGAPAKDIKPAPLSLDSNGRDFFPGMYVLFQKRLLHDERAEDKEKFGLVLKSSNKEKFASVRWFSSNTPGPPVEVGVEETSFYDIRSHPEYNYMNASLVSRLCSAEPKVPCEEKPNVGYVVQKLPDGKVLVSWYGGGEEPVDPWKLSKLRGDGGYAQCSEGSEFSGDVEDGMEHFYSPSEHEFDDLEELRYYDYTNLAEPERWNRIALLVETAEPMVALLLKTILMVHQNFPFMERKHLVKMALHCDDIISGFAHLGRFRGAINNLYKEELGVEAGKNIVTDSATSSTAAPALPPDHHHSYLAGKPSCTNDQLIWNIATWLYDWLEVTQELHVAVSKHRASENSKTTGLSEGPSEVNEATPDILPVQGTETSIEEPFEVSVDNESNKKILTKISDWQSNIQGAFTAVSQVLGHGQQPDLVAGLVRDCCANLKGLLQSENTVMDMGAAGDFEIGSEESDDKKASTKRNQLKAAHHFLKLFVTHAKTVQKLPCFAYHLPPEGELKALAKAWKTFTITDFDQPNTASRSVGVPHEGAATSSSSSSSSGYVSGRREEGKSMESFIRGMGKELEHLGGSLCFVPGDIIPLINDIADALSLSILLMLGAIVHSVKTDLAAEVKEALKEPESLPKDGRGDDAAASSNNPPVKTQESVPEDFGAALSPCSFTVLERAPQSHRFLAKPFDPTISSKSFLSAVRRELKLLQSALPPGIYIKAYEDRMDLFSCMISGPSDTPYADALFFFDVRLKEDFPARPPHVFFKSLSKRLNPNLYEDGMVCLSLLGTWDGKSIEKTITKPPEPFETEVKNHFKECLPRLRGLLEKYEKEAEEFSYPLNPVTQGFCLCIKRHAINIENLLRRHGYLNCDAS